MIYGKAINLEQRHNTNKHRQKSIIALEQLYNFTQD